MFKNERNSANDGSHRLNYVDQLDHSTSFYHSLLFYQYNRSSGKTCFKMCRKIREYLILRLLLNEVDIKTLKNLHGVVTSVPENFTQ